MNIEGEMLAEEDEDRSDSKTKRSQEYIYIDSFDIKNRNVNEM